MRNPLHPSPPFKDVVTDAIGRLRTQHVKLGEVASRLQRRDRTLFDACVKALRRKNRERAIIYANELAEVRKLYNLVFRSQLALERVILRLETIRDLSEIVSDLRPMLKVLQKVARHLSRAMPEIAFELEKVGDSIGETLSLTSLETPQPITPYEKASPAGEEILEEVTALLEQRVMEKLPEPPVSTVTPEAQPRKVRQMVALTASCAEATAVRRTDVGHETTLTYRDLKLDRVSVHVSRSNGLEDIILEYIRRREGEIDIARCAFDLNLPYEEVANTIRRLSEEGRIAIQEVKA